MERTKIVWKITYVRVSKAYGYETGYNFTFFFSFLILFFFFLWSYFVLFCSHSNARRSAIKLFPEVIKLGRQFGCTSLLKSSKRLHLDRKHLL